MKKKQKRWWFLLLPRNAKFYKEKSYHYQIYHCLKVKPSFHKKLFQKEKNKSLLWIYAWRLSGHLWFNARQKSLVAGLKWNPAFCWHIYSYRYWSDLIKLKKKPKTKLVSHITLIVPFIRSNCCVILGSIEIKWNICLKRAYGSMY